MSKQHSYKPPLVCVSISPDRFSCKLLKENVEFIIVVSDFSIVNKMLLCGKMSWES